MADTEISKTIPEAKASKVLPWFLRVHPIPLDENGDPEYTAKEWFTKVLFDYGLREIKEGRKLTIQDAQDDSDLEGVFI
jgi:hypothetical protein